MGDAPQPINNINLELTVNGDNVDPQAVADSVKEAVLDASDQIPRGR